MWVGMGSVWGPKLGVLPKKHQEQHKERGLGHGQEDGGNGDPLQPRVKEQPWSSRSSPGVVDFRKALERHQSPPRVAVEGTVRTAGWGAINPVLGHHKLLEQGAECL